MPASSPMLSSLASRLSSSSQQLLNTAHVLPKAADELSDEEKLDLFDVILDEAERIPASDTSLTPAASTTPTPATSTSSDSVPPLSAAPPPSALPDDAGALFASVTPQALPQATEELWQQSQAGTPTGTSTKERTAATANWSVEAAVEQSGGMMTAVEQEKRPEISPEVEAYLQRIEEDQTSPAKELAQLIPDVATSPTPTSTQVVRVLPITKADAEEGRKKSPKFSIRWLVEWSEKVIKMFKGKTVYRTP